MNSGNDPSPRVRNDLTPLQGQAERLPENRMGRRHAQADDDFGLDDSDFRFKPRLTGRYFSGRRRLVDPPLSTRLALEVLDGVRHISQRPVDSCLLQGLIEYASGGTDEGLA